MDAYETGAAGDEVVTQLPRAAKFVPWEPYKAAVSREVRTTPLKERSDDKLNLQKYSQDKNIVRKLSRRERSRQPDGQESDIPSGMGETDDASGIATDLPQRPQYTLALEELQAQTRKLEEQLQLSEAARSSLEEQLDVQTKVNAELKALLVASVGDDMQLKVESISTDKALLAQHIVHYTEQQSRDSEALERLAVQCDVLRSKFLAGCVLADELASWRVFLVRQFEHAQHTLSQLLDEQEIARNHLFHTFVLLKELRDNFTPQHASQHRELLLHHTQFDLVCATHSLADSLNHHFLNDIRKRALQDLQHTPSVGSSPAEEKARQILKTDTSKFYASSPCEEFSNSAHQRLQKQVHFMRDCNLKNLTLNCCKNCHGEIKLV